MPFDLDYGKPKSPDDVLIYDPFLYKYTLSVSKKRAAYDAFRAFVGYDLGNVRDTTMIYFILKHDIILTRHEMMKVLGLQPSGKVDSTIFDKLESTIFHVARTLRAKVPVRSLLEMPLTDISRICYMIAGKFESLFFAPVNGDDFDFWWTDRFNSVWPVISELNRLYNELG
ncbi:hypothetical protein CXQ85_002375 [Candidozyma haemuli]|uniref:Uncharacterized protein n=1 Tax=Candidozyma haemuli TaxID=45357 RepID=A0A2V1AUJ5_9ASCO|nr:hypothetical protein CXQ85_002375 [[Candida] haemuloni]PVH20581.1 hypothetical protein CXQ85_002375 [[Candida] haemuloni]